MKGVVSGTVLVKPPTHPPEDRIGHHAQGLSLKLQLLAGTPPPTDSPQHPGPLARLGLCWGRGRRFSAGPDAGLGGVLLPHPSTH